MSLWKYVKIDNGHKVQDKFFGLGGTRFFHIFGRVSDTSITLLLISFMTQATKKSELKKT